MMALTDEEVQHLRGKWGLSAATLALFPESYCRAIVASDKRASRIDELRTLADEPHATGKADQ